MAPTDNERLARIEAKLEHIEESMAGLEEMRIEFAALKARWGIAAATIGAMFAGLVTFVVNVIERWLS